MKEPLLLECHGVGGGAQYFKGDGGVVDDKHEEIMQMLIGWGGREEWEESSEDSLSMHMVSTLSFEYKCSIQNRKV